MRINPARFKQARSAAGLSLQQVVDRLPANRRVSRVTLHKYEKGTAHPLPTMLYALGKVYGVRAHSFLTETTATFEWLPCKRPRSLSAAVLNALRSRAELQAEPQLRVERMFPQDRMPALPQGLDLGTAARAEAAAERVRLAWGMGSGPLASLTDTIEFHGGVVVMLDQTHAGFTSMRGVADQGERVFVVRADVTPAERRFDLACDLGRFVVKPRLLSGAERNIALFARALLMPASAARHELGARRRSISADELSLLAERYGVSAGHWGQRARELGIVSSSQRGAVGSAAYGDTSLSGAGLVRDAERPSTRARAQILRAVEADLLTPVEAAELFPALGPKVIRSEPPSGSARALLKLPSSERRRRLREAAERLAPEYAPGGSLEVLEAFGEKDFHDHDEPEHNEPQTRRGVAGRVRPVRRK